MALSVRCLEALAQCWILNSPHRKTLTARSSFYTMTTRGWPARRPQPCVSAGLKTSSCCPGVSKVQVSTLSHPGPSDLSVFSGRAFTLCREKAVAARGNRESCEMPSSQHVWVGSVLGEVGGLFVGFADLRLLWFLRQDLAT